LKLEESMKRPLIPALPLLLVLASACAEGPHFVEEPCVKSGTELKRAGQALCSDKTTPITTVARSKGNSCFSTGDAIAFYNLKGVEEGFTYHLEGEMNILPDTQGNMLYVLYLVWDDDVNYRWPIPTSSAICNPKLNQQGKMVPCAPFPTDNVLHPVAPDNLSIDAVSEQPATPEASTSTRVQSAVAACFQVGLAPSGPTPIVE
jgi:hypothetical protein